ncbi:hypothetical protein JOM56_013931 [Amanita muscaria]
MDGQSNSHEDLHILKYKFVSEVPECLFNPLSMSAKKCSTSVSGGGIPRLEGAVPPPPPAVLESANNGTQHGPPATTVPNFEGIVLDEKGRRFMAKRFKSKQAPSTFMCSLVIAYVAFITHVEQRDLGYGIPYNFGVFLAFLAITAHGISIIVSSQRITICNDFSMERTEEDLQYSLAACSILQFAGTTCFVMAAMGSVFLFFDHILYVVLFFAVSLAGLVAFVYGNGELSRVYANILIIRTMRARNSEA